MKKSDKHTYKSNKSHNKLSTSAALQTHSMWQNTIKYDPYAPQEQNEQEENNLLQKHADEKIKSIFEFAKMNQQSNKMPGACTKCGYAGHLAYQCMNTLQLKSQNFSVQEIDKNEKEKLKQQQYLALLKENFGNNAITGNVDKRASAKDDSHDKKKKKKSDKEKGKDKDKDEEKKKKHKKKSKKHKKDKKRKSSSKSRSRSKSSSSSKDKSEQKRKSESAPKSEPKRKRKSTPKRSSESSVERLSESSSDRKSSSKSKDKSDSSDKPKRKQKPASKSHSSSSS